MYAEIRSHTEPQGQLTVGQLCRETGVSRAGYYRRLAEEHPEEEEQEVREAIQEIAVAHKRHYGYRRITAELRRRGMKVNRKRVARMMREDNLLAIRGRRFVLTTDSEHELEVYLNLAARMKVTGINQLWVADITYIRLQHEFVYLAVVLDAWSRRVIGWAVDRTLAARLAVNGAGECDGQATTRAWSGAPIRSLDSICVARLRGGAGETQNDTEHEQAGQSRQCFLREFHEDPEAGRNLLHQICRSGGSPAAPGAVSGMLLQPGAAAFGARISNTGGVRTALADPGREAGRGRSEDEFFQA